MMFQGEGILNSRTAILYSLSALITEILPLRISAISILKLETYYHSDTTIGKFCDILLICVTILAVYFAFSNGVKFYYKV